MSIHGTVLVLSRVVLALALVGITWVSLAPADRLPSGPDVSDKALHMAAYAGLGIVAALTQRRPRVLLTVALLTAFGLFLEILQAQTGYRAFEWVDLLADALGAAMGVLVVTIVLRLVVRTDQD